MKIHLGSDHAGFKLKEKLAEFLRGLGHEVVDHGAQVYDEKDDYPDFVVPVASAVSADTESKGVIIGGSGEGEAMAANRVRSARAAVLHHYDEKIVSLSREHNDANILSVGARFLSEDEAVRAVKIFLETKFSGDERHVRRLKKF